VNEIGLWRVCWESSLNGETGSGALLPHAQAVSWRDTMTALDPYGFYWVEKVNKTEIISLDKLPDALRDLRIGANMTQLDAAAATGFSNTAISMWEKGKREPSWAVLQRLAKCYGCVIEFKITSGGDV